MGDSIKLYSARAERPIRTEAFFKVIFGPSTVTAVFDMRIGKPNSGVRKRKRLNPTIPLGIHRESFSFFPEDTTEVLTDSVPSEMKLFVIPRNIDFELQTDLKKVIFEKMLFENVHGAVDIKNQAIHLEDLSMRALDADMKAVMVYKAGSPRGGYAGFDFKIRNINIAKLVDFVPALDMIRLCFVLSRAGLCLMLLPMPVWIRQ